VFGEHKWRNQDIRVDSNIKCVKNLYYNVNQNFFIFLVDFIILRHISYSYNFISYYFNIYFLIEFKFYSIIKHLIKILTHYIFFNINNIIFHIYKYNHDKGIINTIIINFF
jgi:hypothetical protein